MTCYLNNTASASSGTAVGKDPDSNQGLRIDGKRPGGVHELLNGTIAQDFVDEAFRKEWPLKWTLLSHTQLWTNIVAFLESSSQLFWQGPYMSSKVAVICESYSAVEHKLSGDSAASPHWDLTLKLRAVSP